MFTCNELNVYMLKSNKIHHHFKRNENDDCGTILSIPPQTAEGGNKTQGSNSIMSTSFALKFWSNKIIDVDIILPITLTVS